MSFKICFYNQKGGVGKTSTTIGCGVALARIFDEIKKHLKNCEGVLIVDLDPNRNSCKVFGKNYKFSLKDILSDKDFDPEQAIYPAYFGDEPIPNLSIIPSDISLAVLQSTIGGHIHKEKYLKRQLDKIKKQYLILIDMPATMCDLALNGVYAADYLVIVSNYESDSIEGIGDLFRFVAEIKETHDFDYKILRNKKDGTTKTNIEYLNVQLDDFQKKGKVFNTIISKDNTIERAKREKETVFTYDPSCKVIPEYMNLAHELKEIVENAKG